MLVLWCREVVVFLNRWVRLALGLRRVGGSGCVAAVALEASHVAALSRVAFLRDRAEIRAVGLLRLGPAAGASPMLWRWCGCGGLLAGET